MKTEVSAHLTESSDGAAPPRGDCTGEAPTPERSSECGEYKSESMEEGEITSGRRAPSRAAWLERGSSAALLDGKGGGGGAGGAGSIHENPALGGAPPKEAGYGGA